MEELGGRFTELKATWLARCGRQEYDALCWEVITIWSTIEDGKELRPIFFERA